MRTVLLILLCATPVFSYGQDSFPSPEGVLFSECSDVHVQVVTNDPNEERSLAFTSLLADSIYRRLHSARLFKYDVPQGMIGGLAALTSEVMVLPGLFVRVMIQRDGDGFSGTVLISYIKSVSDRFGGAELRGYFPLSVQTGRASSVEELFGELPQSPSFNSFIDDFIAEYRQANSGHCAELQELQWVEQNND